MTRLLRRYGSGAPGWATVCALLALCVLLLPAPARADGPLDLARTGRITDTVGALGDRREEVATALERLRREARVQLFVTYVRDFSGRAGHDWADATADRNGLGPRDLVLAIATHDRRYAVSAADDSGFRPGQLARVADAAIEPALKAHAWADAAIGAAAGYQAVLKGRPVHTPVLTPGADDPGGEALVPGGRGVWLPALLVMGSCALGGYLLARRGRRAKDRRAAAPPPALAGFARLAQPLTPLTALDAEAARILVETDDAIRTSEEELDFAIDQFGRRAALPFAEAVAYARGEVARAFRLRQRLDDAPNQDADTRRYTLDEILSRCTSANRRLDAESDAFDRLRAVKENAPHLLARAEETAEELAPRIDEAEAALTELARGCTASALAPVAQHPAEARDRLAFAAAGLAQARRSLAENDPAGAAPAIRAAEGALAQARTLTAAVLRHAHGVLRAGKRLRALLPETEAALARARALLADRSGLRAGSIAAERASELCARIARTEHALAGAAREMAGGRYDPLAALQRVEEAGAGLDELLEEEGARERRVWALGARALLAARSDVAAARDFVCTHRGAIGSRARTRLAEAERHLARAEEAADATDDAADARLLPEARLADALARQARELAERDVRSYADQSAHAGPYAPQSPHPAGAIGGAMLGGIILGGLLPATFGGGGTRGRLAE
ncbi:TPM domain-containing protein [Streptomyces sp. NPDC050617]|uniref:TPM domain-containing protein n=1 Tax=Streptomyces sp. NPDC050617 TaxID=3154628 RepID=UPI00341A16E2